MSVIVKNLIKIYGSQRAVDDISFKVEPGEVLGFLGPNGAGKSTTMKIATCYLPPSSGQVEICGYNVETDPIEVRRNVGYLPEHNPLYLDMYVHEYLDFAGSVYGLRGSVLRNRTRELVQLTGLSREQNKKIGALSKGYRQRVGLAQAMIHDPKVLILDEPTTGLDPNQIIEIRNLISNIGKEKTVIFSTHIMQEVQAICSRAIIINLGRIVADSPVDELRNLSGQSVVIVAEFDAEVDVNLLQAVDGVGLVKSLDRGKYEIAVAGKQDIRRGIFRLAAEQGWTLLGMQQQENSLEKIFQNLTQDSN
jgi:ABC-2 type transport system ATP-binding protein